MGVNRSQVRQVSCAEPQICCYKYSYMAASVASAIVFIQSGARKTDPPSRRPTWAQVSDSVQETKQTQMQSTYWLDEVLKMISLYVNALLCTLQHIVTHAMHLSGVNDTVELHRVYDNMLQRAQKCIDVQGDHFQHLL